MTDIDKLSPSTGKTTYLRDLIILHSQPTTHTIVIDTSSKIIGDGTPETDQ